MWRVLRVPNKAVEQDFFNFFAKDRRFRDPAWQDGAFFQHVKELYLNYQKSILEEVRSSNLPTAERNAATFWMKMFLDACSPSNFPVTNPEVLKQTFRENGNNFVRGVQNFWNDMAQNPHFFPPLTDTNAFKLGENIANTPGNVVFENDVFQLIQYTPLAPQSYTSPLLLIPAWVNKYYLFDMSEQTSFVRYNLEQGRSVFCVSWVNPTRAQHYLTMRHYLDRGVELAIEEVYARNAAACKLKPGEGKVNVAAICVGGTFLLTKLAEKAHAGQPLPIASLSLLMTPFDFEYLEWVRFFINETTIHTLRHQLDITPITSETYGVILGEAIMRMFCCLRDNDLIWPNYVQRYLLGNALPSIDFLYWNHDAPRIPVRMLCDYVEAFFIHNAFMQDAEPVGLRCAISELAVPSFVFGTERDHIVPWESCYTAAQTLPNARFVLGGAGHVVGCINPPSAHRYHYWSLPETAETTDLSSLTPVQWLQAAQRTEGSWWTVWDRWLTLFCGRKVPAWGPSNSIEPAPGRYAS